MDAEDEAVSKKDDGGPAFPQSAVQSNDGMINTPSVYFADVSGMTLRDWFAGQALAGIAAPFCGYEGDRAAERAYELADAMLKERAK